MFTVGDCVCRIELKDSTVSCCAVLALFSENIQTTASIHISVVFGTVLRTIYCGCNVNLELTLDNTYDIIKAIPHKERAESCVYL